jgi:ribonuclease D
MDEADLPVRTPRSDGPPMPRAWAERDPVAARRLALARAQMTLLAADVSVPVENLLTPDYLRRVLWTPPQTREPQALEAEVAALLTALGARQWQRELVGPVLVAAIIGAEEDDVDVDVDAAVQAVEADLEDTTP